MEVYRHWVSGLGIRFEYWKLNISNIHNFLHAFPIVH
jgi:hypothetical protein